MTRAATGQLIWAIVFVVALWVSRSPGSAAVAEIAVAEISVAVALAALALIASLRRPDRGLALVAGVAFVVWVAGWWMPALVFLHRGAVAHLVLAYPRGRPRSWVTWLAIGAVYALSAVPAVASEPAAIIACAVLVIGAAVARLARERGGARRYAAVSLYVSSVLTVGWTAPTLLRAAGAEPATVTAVYPLVTAYVVTVLLIDLALARTRESALLDLALDLGGVTDHRTLQDRVAHAVGDPDLRIVFLLHDGRHVDDAGRPVSIGELSTGRNVTRIAGSDRDVAALIHDPAIRMPGVALAAIGAATALVVRNVELHAGVRAQAAAVERSRQRLVEAEQHARRTVERAIESGPRERLRTVSQLLAGAAGTPAHRLAASLGRADADLVRFGHGLTPTLGIDLSETLRELADGMPFPVAVSVDVPEGIDPRRSRAVWLVAAEALTNAAKHSEASRVSLSVRVEDGALLVSVVDDGCGGAALTAGGLGGIRGRVEELGGTFALNSPLGTGTSVAVRLPPVARADAGAPAR